ncbi:MAG TPA: helix-turn-helix transcriptional regulator [Acidimicrobiales bacterium]|jgi:transcriptional regulator with XRE-family HTH domain
MDGWALRRRRREAGLTAAQVARVTGTSESNIAAYERGDKVPGSPTLQRIVDAIDAGSESDIYLHGLVTTPEASAAIRHGLRGCWTNRELLRIVREQRSNAKWVSRSIDQKVFFARPSTTGDRRWDALLAGSTEELTLRSNAQLPNWTKGIRLGDDWFVTDDPGFNDYLRAHSPEPFRSRGVMIDPDALESV